MAKSRLFAARILVTGVFFMSLCSALLTSSRNSVRGRVTSFSDIRPYLNSLSDMRFRSSCNDRKPFRSHGISFSKRKMSSNSGRVTTTSNRMKTITVGVNERNNLPREMDENNEYIPSAPLEPLVLTLSGMRRILILF